MSRLGKRPIAFPSSVNVKLEGKRVQMKGSKGDLTRSFDELTRIVLTTSGNEILVARAEETGDARREQGLAHALIHNMVVGVTEGFSRGLEIVGVGYRAQVKGKVLGLSLGHSHPIDFDIPEGITITVNKQIVLISGANKELVGETAARIRKLRAPEPYKGKGVKYVDEVIRRKAGKSAATAKGAG
ncbi:MAG: 50S ribosomal protein L6 [Deltaproteobacteria bacterium RIFCSPLOWO2_02_FULL_44_10]|nr:MAG: 50S ribosomal protein L6 [Deltaproteobacteria bacterium RIFCSPHIGHO2_02_FULL_44_16]OGQ45574.1 MAG: 50S ribosomal protein L6 [Deltaproteobacteria bacterium RIFCSPLOWO2_02_FULL_44_10]